MLLLLLVSDPWGAYPTDVSSQPILLSSLVLPRL